MVLKIKLKNVGRVKVTIYHRSDAEERFIDERLLLYKFASQWYGIITEDSDMKMTYESFDGKVMESVELSPNISH